MHFTLVFAIIQNKLVQQVNSEYKPIISTYSLILDISFAIINGITKYYKRENRNYLAAIPVWAVIFNFVIRKSVLLGFCKD